MYAQVEPLPFVPATCIVETFYVGYYKNSITAQYAQVLILSHAFVGNIESLNTF